MTYTVILRPQSIHYTKSYESADDDEEVIPFQDIPIDKWKDQYFFFDYVLLSGATWDGPIGRETIELSAEPALRLDLSQILVVPRSPVGFRPRGLPIDGGEWSETMVLDGIRRWVIEKTKPDSDLLLAIPASMIKSEAPSASK